MALSVKNRNNQPPQTPNNIGNNKSNEYQSDDLVGVHDHLLGLDPLSSVGLVKIVLDEALDSRLMLSVAVQRNPLTSIMKNKF